MDKQESKASIKQKTTCQMTQRNCVAKEMDVVQKSAEHHFLTSLQKLKKNPEGWAIVHFALSNLMDHRKVTENFSNITENLNIAYKKSETVFRNLMTQATEIKRGAGYHFADHDVVLLAHLKNSKEQKHLQTLFEKTKKSLPAGLSNYKALARDLFFYEDFADRKLISAQKMQAYAQMADQHKISSIPIRRTRRDCAQILLVEDDRFTASYAANILNTEYDVILARSGEEAISAYINHAPDMVFLDVHLPGLNGHQTLEAIKAIDPEAFVVMLSVDSIRKNVEAASDNGAYSFLKKPFSKERLHAMTKQSPYIRASMNRQKVPA